MRDTILKKTLFQENFQRCSISTLWFNCGKRQASGSRWGKGTVTFSTVPELRYSWSREFAWEAEKLGVKSLAAVPPKLSMGTPSHRREEDFRKAFAGFIVVHSSFIFLLFFFIILDFWGFFTSVECLLFVCEQGGGVPVPEFSSKACFSVVAPV